MPFVYLASQSPRRSQLLTQMGVAHELLLPQADDPDPSDHPDALEALEATLAHEWPRDYVQRVTGLKLQAAMRRAQRRGLAGVPILCADTTVALGPRILGKAVDAQEAREMLGALSGQNHAVLTAVAVALDGQVRQALSVSQVQFADVSQVWLDGYIASGEWQGKAGAYGIQGLAATMVAHIEGSYSGIMGLPVFETYQLLQASLAQPVARNTSAFVHPSSSISNPHTQG
ncbi:septum formation protein Maf [Lampropedia puyangensis]|uniref:dTTP/UTP pyrophosphatase n=1 Tax=Lampropedia puyangensis TaxID=1330072 RepID=A0A4S8F892_9BURK|nr:Maf family protein [Lampropedia puyangensis]THU03720.1 septum formation protein Maf [Lampropedia puyangensis]